MANEIGLRDERGATMIATYYPELKVLHIGLALASGAFFAIRGLMRLLGARWPMAAPVRHASYTLDSLLLLSGIALLWALRLSPLATSWLAVKLLLIVLYILLGIAAMRRRRLGAYLGALALFLSAYAVARSHHPLGPLWRLLA